VPKTNKNILLVFCLALGLVFSCEGASARETININTDTTWTKETSDLVFDKPIAIGNGATLTIEKGTRVVFQVNPNQPFNSAGFEVLDGKLVANGTREENIVFTSPDDGFKLLFSDNDQPSFLLYVTLENGGFIPTMEGSGDFVPKFPVFEINGGKVHIENSQFANSRFREISISDVPIQDAEGNDVYDENDNLVQNKAQVDVINSNFSNQNAVDSQLDCWAYDEEADEDYVDQDCLKRVNLKDDWFGNPAGPTTDEDEEQGIVKGYRVTGQFYLDSWRTADEIIDASQNCMENCFSNVLFLPGIKTSRLYRDGDDGKKDKLWLPDYFEDDLEKLALDENGKSVNEVYTQDVLDSIGIWGIGGDIYKNFIDILAELKTKNTINDYESFAYDWRQSVEDVAQNGTPYENITKSAIVDLQALAENSKSKKVTIVAHSNGGLVAKAVMMELEKLGMADKVDKVILVGTPQMGTPISILSLLYGYDEESTFLQVLISREDARALAENMPGAYGLLPGEKYFERMESPFIKFSSENTRYKSFKDAYGENIDNFDEFRKFLLGKDDGREDPDKSDVEMENVLNEKILNQAREIHQHLDNWVPPSTVEVIQIAGWGLDTISGVEYTEKEKTQCYIAPGAKIPSCSGMGEYESVYEPKFTVDGDRVVVAPSALMLAESENVKRYWVDLYGYNDNNVPDREHKNITEIESVRNVLDMLIRNLDLSSNLPEFIKSSRPDDYAYAQPRLRMSLYSPLDIHLYDDFGHHTGPKKNTDENGQEYVIFEKEIPNSYYYQFGERKYAGFPKGEHIRVEMDGYALGSYTLKLEEAKVTEAGEETIAQTAFENLPTTADTTVKLEIPETGIENPLSLQADIDSDGAVEYELASVQDGAVTLDVIAPVAEISIAGTKSNKEESKTETIRIDKATLEANVQFNPDTQKTDISGADNLTQVSVVPEEQIGDNSHKSKNKIYSWLSKLFLGKQDRITTVVATLMMATMTVIGVRFVKKWMGW